MQIPKTTAEHQPFIEGLRAIAVLAVIVNHFSDKLLPGGYLGVDIFFVISGYVITRSLRNRSDFSTRIFLLSFYERRVKRLLPALIFCVLATSIALCVLSPTPSTSLKTGVLSLFGLSNMYLIKNGTDYFAESSDLNAFTQTWSLGVEEQFYLLFPLLFVVSAYFGGPEKRLKNLSLAMLFLSTASVASFLYLHNTRQPLSFFLMPARFWEIGAGSLLCLFFDKNDGKKRGAVRRAIVWLCLIMGCLFIPDKFSAAATIAIVCLTALTIVSLNQTALLPRFLVHPAMLYTGKISYSLYLWHWSILSLSRWSIGIEWWTAPFQIIAMFLIAGLSFRYIEQPLRHMSWTASGPKTIGLGFVGSCCASLLLYSLIVFGHHLSLDRNFSASPLIKTLDRHKFWGAKRDTGCHVSYEASELAASACLGIDTALDLVKPNRLFVLGDSHANQYVDSLKKALPDWQIKSFTAGWGCGYILPDDIRPNVSKTFKCSTYIETVDRILSVSLRPGDTILLAHRWKVIKEYRHFRGALQKIAALADEKQARILLIDDNFELEVNPVLCEKQPWRPNVHKGCFKQLSQVLADQQEYDKMRYEIASANSHVFALNLRSHYCDGKSCGPILNGMGVFSDGNHLSRQASAIGAKAIADFVSNQRW